MDCIWGKWTKWSGCPPPGHGGLRRRNRYKNPGRNGGKGCHGKTSQIKNC